MIVMIGASGMPGARGKHLAGSRKRSCSLGEATGIGVELRRAAGAAEPVPLAVMVADEARGFGVVFDDDVARHDRADGELVLGSVQRGSRRVIVIVIVVVSHDVLHRSGIAS